MDSHNMFYCSRMRTTLDPQNRAICLSSVAKVAHTSGNRIEMTQLDEISAT